MGMLIGASFPNEFEMLKEKNVCFENKTEQRLCEAEK